MPIVSLSFPEGLLEEMNELQKSSGFTGRSELVRAAVRLLLEDSRERNELVGNTAAVIVVSHEKEDEEPVTRLKHKFEDIVRTHVHCKVSHEDCVEVFVLAGDGQQINSMMKEFQRERRIRSVRLLTT